MDVAMSAVERAVAAERRKAFWNIHDNVSPDQMSDGCPYCVNGWANGPGVVYRCLCNPGEPNTIDVDD
jgi:hypothetical protein